MVQRVDQVWATTIARQHVLRQRLARDVVRLMGLLSDIDGLRIPQRIKQRVVDVDYRTKHNTGSSVSDGKEPILTAN